MPTPSATSCAAAASAPYLHTCGSRIVDAAGAPVQLRAVNWYGFDSNDFVAAGLHLWSYKTIVDRIKALGFNALRVPFSNELVERNPVVSDLRAICVALPTSTPGAMASPTPGAPSRSCVPVPGTTNTPISGTYLLAAISDTVQTNTDLVGLDALHVLKAVVDYAGSQGLYVILDDHRSQAAWGPQENGLWYTAAACPTTAAPYTCYDPASWLHDWQTLGALFADDPAVIGMDLRNEPHWRSPTASDHFRPTSCAAYVQFAHWGPCNGLNNAATDWAQAANGAGDALLALNPHWLMVVEGGSTYPQDAGGTVFSQDGWGENLRGAASDPVTLAVPHQLVYSAHDYRWYQANDNVTQMYATWTRNFGFVAVPGQAYTAPLWLGEYGTCTSSNTCVMSPPPGSPGYGEGGWWFNTFRFYGENRCVTDTTTNTQVCPPGAAPDYMGGPVSWAYWPANGIYVDSWNYDTAPSLNSWRTCYGQRESYGVLGSDMATPSNQLLLQSLLDGPSSDPATTLASAAPPSGPWLSYTCKAYSG